MPDERRLPYPRSGDPIAAKDIVQLSDALKLFRRQVNGDLTEGGVKGKHFTGVDQFLARVSDAQTSGLPSSLYTLVRNVLPATQSPAGLLTPVPDPFGPFPLAFIAVNLAELTGDTPPAGSGATPVAAGQTVQVTRWRSLTNAGGPDDSSTGGNDIYTFYFGNGSGNFVVNVVQSGGSNGVANVSASTYAYDVFRRNADGTSGTQIGTSVAVVKRRRMYGPVGVAVAGEAFYEGGAVKLWDVDETYGYGCS